eukprot:Gb_40492 [translate_table: standard]
MSWSNSYLGRPRTKENNVPQGHLSKLLGLYGSGIAENNGIPEKSEEYDEEDIWAVDSRESSEVFFQENGVKNLQASRMNKESNSRCAPVASRMIPAKNVNNSEENGRRMRYQSAPVNIPDWSKILREENDHPRRRNSVVADDDSEDEDDDEIIPPHEVIARQLGRSQITPFSVYEGAGRTLKGRDLSKVRNAVWTRTGFLE